MATTKTANPHAWFYSALKQLPNYNEQYRDVIKAGVIAKYSNGQTESIRELYWMHPELYKKMRDELSVSNKKAYQRDEIDKARKRLIAAIFGYLEGNGYKPDMAYVKKVACNAAKVSRFNDIPINTLKNQFNHFKNKNLTADAERLKESVGLK